MSGHVSSDSVLGDTFLASLQSALIDCQDECPICTMKYSDSQEKHITTDCGHTYHYSCLRTWLEVQCTEWATCPMCRANLFRRPGFEADLYGGYFSDEDNHSWDPPGWEGLWTAYQEINASRQVITQIIEHIWSVVERLGWINAWEAAHWEHYVTAILDAYASLSGYTLTPCSAAEYMFVRTIIDLLGEHVHTKRRSTRELDNMLFIFNEHEEAADEHTIEQAYEAAGLGRLFPECGLLILFADEDELDGYTFLGN